MTVQRQFPDETLSISFRLEFYSPPHPAKATFKPVLPVGGAVSKAACPYDSTVLRGRCHKTALSSNERALPVGSAETASRVKRSV